MEWNKEFLKVKIIGKLVQWNKWGGAHTENILGGIPRSMRGNKITKEAIKELIQDNWLIASVKTQEIHFSLNPEKVSEILEFYERNKEE